MRKVTIFAGVIIAMLLPALFGQHAMAATATNHAPDHWVGTWGCAPQLVEPANLPPAPGLSNNTLRQVVHVSIGGDLLRLKFSNNFGTSPVTMNSVHLAVSEGDSTIDPATDRHLTFTHKPSITIPAGQSIASDPLFYHLAPLANMVITIYFGATSADVTGHPGSRTTSYIQAGDAVTATSLPTAATTAHWYIITGMDVLASGSSGAVVTLGDSITDGRGTTTDGNNRWPDDLARRLQADPRTSKVAVLNEGIGGNNVLSGGLGPAAVDRFDRDVLDQSGARWLIILEGVNDIGTSTGDSQTVAENLIAAYKLFIAKAHAHHILVYGVPILPFEGSQYTGDAHEAARQTVNSWIRTSGKFDAVIDMDAAVRDPANPAALLSAYDSGDHLHLNPAGYQKMADTINLALFSGRIH
jgi:lysophospholipase L1-like esterase